MFDQHYDVTDGERSFVSVSEGEEWAGPIRLEERDFYHLAGADLGGTELEHHARCIERSHKMITLVDNAVELLRTRHKSGEEYYWLLYYTYLSPQQFRNVEEIIEQLRPHIHDISFRTYYRRQKEAMEAVSSILWGYTSKDSLQLLDELLPDWQ